MGLIKRYNHVWLKGPINPDGGSTKYYKKLILLVDKIGLNRSWIKSGLSVLVG